jgi:hypothetical protein
VASSDATTVAVSTTSSSSIQERIARRARPRTSNISARSRGTSTRTVRERASTSSGTRMSSSAMSSAAAVLRAVCAITSSASASRCPGLVQQAQGPAIHWSRSLRAPHRPSVSRARRPTEGVQLHDVSREAYSQPQRALTSTCSV